MNDISTTDTVSYARQRLEELIAFFGANVEVEVDVTDDGIELSIGSSPISPRLIGHRGDTLRATEFLVGQMVKRHDPLAPRVLVDIAGYKRSRREALEQMAAEVAARVKESGAEEELKPMNPAERRIVHMVLREIDGIESESRGTDRTRHIVVKPAD